MVCWCETNEKEKTKAIADADAKDKDLVAEIEERLKLLMGLTHPVLPRHGAHRLLQLQVDGVWRVFALGADVGDKVVRPPAALQNPRLERGFTLIVELLPTAAVHSRHLQDLPVVPHNAEVPEELEHFVLAAMEKDPQQRIASAQEFYDRLQEIQAAVT